MLQHQWRVLYISHVEEQSCKLGRRKISCESSQTLNICFLTELSHLESFPNTMNGVASSLSLWQLTCDHTVDTFPLIWMFAISTSFSTIQGSSSLCHKNGDNVQNRNRNSYSEVMPYTVASSRIQPLFFFFLINVSVIFNTLVYSFLLDRVSVRCCLVFSPGSASRGYTPVAVLVLLTCCGFSWVHGLQYLSHVAP